MKREKNDESGQASSKTTQEGSKKAMRKCIIHD